MHFYQVYRASSDRMAFIALGVRRLTKAEGIAYIPAGSDPRKLFGKVEERGDEEGTFTVRVDAENSWDGKPTLWTFEPLTIERFKEMGDFVTAGNRVLAQCKTDEYLRVFYLIEFLFRYWEEDYKEGLPVD